jgi:hypothetical protein
VLHHAGDWQYLREELEKRDLPALPFGEPEIEDVRMMAAYADSVALRKRSGRFGYDSGAIAYLSERLPLDAALRNPDYLTDQADLRLRRLVDLLSQDIGYIGAIADEAPFCPIEGAGPD